MKKRMISLLLCCVFTFCTVSVQQEPAKAVAPAIPAVGIAVIASVLLGSGAQFGDQEALNYVCNDIYQNFIAPVNSLQTQFLEICNAFTLARVQGISTTAIILSSALWEVICGKPIRENVSNGHFNSWTSRTIPSGTAEEIRASLSPITALANARKLRAIEINGVRYSSNVQNGKLHAFVNGLSVFEGTISAVDFNPFVSLGFIPSTLIIYPVFFTGMWGNAYDTARFDKELAITFPCTIAIPDGYSVPIKDADKVANPSSKKKAVFLSGVLPTVNPDGTIQYPEMSLEQSDYLVDENITVEENVVYNTVTGEAIKPVGDIVAPDTSILSSILSLLRSIWEAISNIPALVMDGIKTLFLPSQVAVDTMSLQLNSKLPMLSDLEEFGSNFAYTLANPKQSAEDLRLTTVVDLGKKSGGIYGNSKINLLDLTWYLPYKPLVDDIIVGFMWLVFLWNLYGAIPRIIHGGASALVSTSGIANATASRENTK